MWQRCKRTKRTTEIDNLSLGRFIVDFPFDRIIWHFDEYQYAFCSLGMLYVAKITLSTLSRCWRLTFNFNRWKERQLGYTMYRYWVKQSVPKYQKFIEPRVFCFWHQLMHTADRKVSATSVFAQYLRNNEARPFLTTISRPPPEYRMKKTTRLGYLDLAPLLIN